MSFTFFTFGGKFLWEDIYNYQGWIIQRNIDSLKCRLLDPYNIRRASGSFEQCKAALLKYISSYELPRPYKDTILILHGYGRSKSSLKQITHALKNIKANIIPLSYASLRRGIVYHANMLSQLIDNLDIKGKLYIINIGTSCLITRKMLTNTDNYRNYNIARILDINPLNSGSDLAELIVKNRVLAFLGGPMLKDISTPYAVKVPRLPNEIEHGIIFSPLTLHSMIKNMLSKFESFPFSTPPSELSYATADNIKQIQKSSLFPLKNPEMLKCCKNFIESGTFDDEE